MLLLALGGFFAMHGLAATASGTQHYSTAAIAASAGGHDQPVLGLESAAQLADSMTDPGPMTQPLPDGALAAAPTATGPAGPADHGTSHRLMAGCVFVLCGLVLILAAYLLRAAWNDRAPASTAAHRFGGRPERPPPRRIYLSLCLLRL